MKKIVNKKTFKIISIVVTAVFFITVFYTAYDYLFVYHIKLNGNSTDTVNLKSTYKDPGISVKYRGKYLKNYKEEDNINIKKEGSYDVKYSVGNKTLTRKVIVKDIEGPVIKLIGGNFYPLSYNSEYVEPGYIAIDNSAGDVTDKVEVIGEVDSKKIGEYHIKYKAVDSLNNVSEVERIVKVEDKESPTITFKNNKGYAIKGSKFDIRDYTATDNYDGDVTDKVEVNGTIDTNIVGVYTIKYTVSDSNGNKATIDRVVNVQNKNTKGIPVLMYHWFYDDTKGEKAGEANTHNYIAKTNLVNQVKYLTENNYYYPTWQELIDYINKKIDLPEKSVIITDDDCVDSFFNVALPVFQEYKVPVTSFCITKKSNWQKYIGADYLDFESHTDNLHTRKCKDTKWDGAVMCTSYDKIYKDIKLSVSKVENTYAFAYPFGHYNDDTINALKKNNIKLAFTINSGRVKKGDNKYKLRRVRISKGTDLKMFMSLVK